MIDYDSLHRKRIRKYIIAIEKAFADLIAQTSSLAMRVKLKDELFQFRKHPYILKGIEKALSDYRTAVMDNILLGTSNEWEFANLKSDALKVALLEKVKDKVAPEILSGQYEKLAESPRNLEALKAFQERKKSKFTISERVWNIESGIKKELEFALDIALTEGKSAQQLAREIKQYLNYPDKLFRRVRDKHGNLVISKNAETFNPGQGVYRSSHKNALRLAANEINIAYRESEQLRIAGNPDVVGIKISLSPQHSVRDVCDELVGIYPKDFVWNGFHVFCKCNRTTVLKSDEEFISELNQGLELPPESSKNFVKSPPKEFDKWINENAPRLQRAKSKPQFVTENKKYIKANVNSGKSILSLNDIKKADGVNVISEDIFKKDGQWNPARQKIHDNIIKEYFKGEQAKADDYVYMLGGAGANGKSTLTESGKLPHPKGALIVDPDKIKGMIPEYKMMLDSNDKYLSTRAANFVHEESSYVSKEIRKRAFDNKISTVLDGVNDGSAEKIHDNAELIRKMTGKKVRADYVSLDTDLSINLALARAKKTGRMVPLERLRADNKAISAEFGTVLKNKSFDELFLWDTNENGKPRLILSQIKGTVKIYDNDLYERFLRKAKD